jgi:hypothetical protein
MVVHGKTDGYLGRILRMRHAKPQAAQTKA